MPNAASRPTFDWRILAGIALIAGGIAVAYQPALHGGFIWDDELLISNNELVQAPDGLYRIWFTREPIDYWPATNTTFWIEWHLWGANTTPYHLFNFALHLADSLLVWLVLRKLQIPGAFLAALLFAVHPVNVESVAWIAQRKNLLAMLFALVSVWLYLKSSEQQSHKAATVGRAGARKPWRQSKLVEEPAVPQRDQRPRLYEGIIDKWYALSLLAFVLAMLSKGSVAVVPIVLLLIAWWQRNRIGRPDLIRTAPFFAIAAALTLVNIWFQTHGQEVIRHAGIAERLAGAGAIVWFYLGKAVWPSDLQFVYPLWEIHTNEFRWWLPTVAAVAVTSILLWQRNNRWLRPVLLAWAYFCIALLPVMGFADVYFMKYSLVADHYEHLALIGIVALAGAALFTVAEHARGLNMRDGIANAALATVVIALVAVCMVLSRRQSETYIDQVTLYEAVLKRNPNNFVVLTNLGSVWNERHSPSGAIPVLERASKLRPEFPEIEFDLGVAYQLFANNAEEYHADLYRQAAEHFAAAAKIQPEWLEAHFNAGHEFLNAKQPQQAIPQFEAVLTDKPDSPAAHFELGEAYSQLEQWPKALVQYQRALDLVPEHPVARQHFATALAKLVRTDHAADQFQQAIQLSPEFVVYADQIVLALLKLFRPEEARRVIEEAKTVARLNNDLVQLHSLERLEQSHAVELMHQNIEQ